MRTQPLSHTQRRCPSAQTLVSPKRLIEMYQTNEAYADERYSDKLIRVRGKVVRIRSIRTKGVGTADPQIYKLELDAEGAAGCGG